MIALMCLRIRRVVRCAYRRVFGRRPSVNREKPRHVEVDSTGGEEGVELCARRVPCDNRIVDMDSEETCDQTDDDDDEECPPSDFGHSKGEHTLIHIPPPGGKSKAD